MKKIDFKRLMLVSRLLFLIYLIITLYFLLFEDGFGRDRTDYAYNLTLFKEIKRYWSWAKESDTGVKMMLLNVVGNILFFVPYGFFLPLVSKRMKSCVIVTVMTFAFSLMVETFQLMLKIGSFDVDDLLLNTLGGLTGYAIYRLLVKISSEKGKRKKNDETEGAS